MAEGERGRGGYRRKKFYVNKDKDKDRLMRGERRKDVKIFKEEEKEIKTPIILTKPKPEQEKSDAVQPTILLKAREAESRTVSPNPPSSPMPKASDKTAASNYQIASKVPAIPDLKMLSCGEMQHCVPLLGSRGEELVEELTDQSDYLVISAIGAPGSGKTTTLARLAKPYPSAKNVFDKSEGQGLHAFMTSSRVLLIDSPPIPSLILSWMGKSRDQTLFDLESDRLALHYTAFLMSVSHVMIVVLGNDNKQNENVIKFLLAIEKVKPVTMTQGAEPNEVVAYWPQILLLHNRCPPESFLLKNINELQERYKVLFEKSKLQIETGLGTANGGILPIIKPEVCSVDPINLFFLPEIENKAQLKNLDTFRGHLGYQDLLGKLRMQLFSAEPLPIGHGVFTEKNWYQYAVKTWDKLGKGSKLSNVACLLLSMQYN